MKQTDYNNPLISVIIPYYNGEKYIKDTLHSVLAQTYQYFEIIIIDDGSSNESSSIYLHNLLLEVNDPRIKYFKKKNEGLSKTRNFGITQSQGEWIALLDQDDLWSPNKLFEQVNATLENVNVAIIYTDAIYIDEHTHSSNKLSSKIQPHHGKCFIELLENNFITCSSVMIKKSCIKEAGFFNHKYKYAEEWDLFLRIMENSKNEIYYINELLTTYRFHNLNSSNTFPRIERITEIIDIISRYMFDKQYVFLKENKILKKNLVNAFYTCSKIALYEYKLKKMSFFILKAIKTSPIFTLFSIINDIAFKFKNLNILKKDQNTSLVYR
ncbi:MAG: glycosyltransferase [Oligoflexia bacterium]|nr:glycosyltransferase [Oligoflexia bacterium]